MKNKKWWKRILISLLVLGILGAGGTAGVRYWLKNRGKAVEVYRVSDLDASSWISWGDGEGTSGTVVADVSQNVQVPEDKVISEVYVEEGDTVKIGDKLMAYDTTLLELDQELQELTVQELQLELKAAEADLRKLQNTTPVARSTGSLGDEDSDESFENEDQARLITGEREMLAAQEGQEEASPETAVSENPEAQTSSDAGPAGETGDNRNETAQNQDQTEAPTDEVIIENLTPADLDQAPQGEEIPSGNDSFFSEEEPEKPKLNQSLEGFLQNIRIKEKTQDGEEILLADTISGEENLTAVISSDQISVIPHFKESDGYIFRQRNTYRMYIKGIRLQKETAGKIYGTASVDGNDYPEIGGFTCVQDTENEAQDVVKLTLAFHDGLMKQQEGQRTLEDMYLELPLKIAELTGESLIFRAGEKNQNIYLVKPQITEPEQEPSEEEPGSEDESEAETPEQSESQSESESRNETEQESQISGAEETETESQTSGTEETETESQTSGTEETETESQMAGTEETETESQFVTESETQVSWEPIGKFTVTVNWNHGTNAREKWPLELPLKFYADPEDEEPIFTEIITAPYREEGGTGQTNGTEEPETEAETEQEFNDSSEMETETEQENGVLEDPEDPYPVTVQTWNQVEVVWPEDRKNPDQYYMAVFAQNYIPTVTWDGQKKAYLIQMNYLEPEESPLAKLDPISEFTFATGAEGMYYKGSGTPEDPYVFFCTDGAVIRNTFVNWVLGFDELGTERISDGYAVVLEIRESDSITGAFIRSVGLDGTIRVEYGYDPSTYWVFTSDSGIVKYQEEIPDDNGGDIPGMDPGWSDIGESYTAEELAIAIAEKQREIRQLKVEEKKANLELKKYNKQLEESVVVSSVNGYVKSLGGSENSDAYMVVASQNGLYVKSTVSEMDLDHVKKGQVVNCSSWETGMQFTATITQVDTFPASTSNSDSYWGGSGNSNSSNYPVLAVVDDPDVVSEYEAVSVSFPKESQMSSGSIYLEKAYIRSENGQSYVYIADENGLLKKQYVRTGGNSYGYVEIKEGLSREDQIAFPYGKDVKAGAKTVDVNAEDE